MKLDDHDIENIRELLKTAAAHRREAQLLSYAAIANKYDVDKGTIYRIARGRLHAKSHPGHTR